MIDMQLSRRHVLGGAIKLGAALCASGLIGDALGAALPERRLAFRNVHTNERVDARYFGAHGFDAQGLAELDHGLRDWRANQAMPIDRGLFDLLAGIRDRLGVAPRRPFDLISGYRSPHTNAALHERGGAQSGVASRSQHLLGKATDIALPGVALDRLRSAALHARRGGVGYYPQDGFVHVDTGPLRSWIAAPPSPAVPQIAV